MIPHHDTALISIVAQLLDEQADLLALAQAELPAGCGAACEILQALKRHAERSHEPEIVDWLHTRIQTWMQIIAPSHDADVHAEPPAFAGDRAGQPTNPALAPDWPDASPVDAPAEPDAAAESGVIGQAADAIVEQRTLGAEVYATQHRTPHDPLDTSEQQPVEPQPELISFEEFRKQLSQAYRIHDLELMISDLGINPESFRRETITLFASDAILGFYRQGRIGDLIEKLKQDRSHQIWPDLNASTVPTTIVWNDADEEGDAFARAHARRVSHQVREHERNAALGHSTGHGLVGASPYAEDIDGVVTGIDYARDALSNAMPPVSVASHLARQRERGTSQVRRVADHSLAVPAMITALDQIPFPPQWIAPEPDFTTRRMVHRHAAIADILKLLDEPEHAVVITGMPGLGKTVISEQLAHHLAQQFGGVFFEHIAELRPSPSDLAPILTRWASHGFGLRQVAADIAPDVVRQILRPHKPLLVILDDVRDARIVPALREALPEHALLITATARQIALELSNIQHYELQPFSEDEVEQFIHQYLRDRPISDDDRGWITHLQELVRGHPVALEAALGAIARSGRDEWAGIVQNIAVAFSQSTDAAQQAGNDERYDIFVHLSLDEAYKSLDLESQARFRLLGALAPDADASIELIASLWECSVQDARTTMNELVNASLVSRIEGVATPVVWRQHALLRTFAARLLLQHKEQGAIRFAHACLTMIQSARKQSAVEAIVQMRPQILHACLWSIDHEPHSAATLAQACPELFYVKSNVLSIVHRTQAACSAAHQQGNVQAILDYACTLIFALLYDLGAYNDYESLLRGVFGTFASLSEPEFESEPQIKGAMHTLRGHAYTRAVDVDGTHLTAADMAAAAVREAQQALALLQPTHPLLGVARSILALAHCQAAETLPEMHHYSLQQAFTLYDLANIDLPPDTYLWLVNRSMRALVSIDLTDPGGAAHHAAIQSAMHITASACDMIRRYPELKLGTASMSFYHANVLAQAYDLPAYATTETLHELLAASEAVLAGAISGTPMHRRALLLRGLALVQLIEKEPPASESMLVKALENSEELLREIDQATSVEDLPRAMTHIYRCSALWYLGQLLPFHARFNRYELIDSCDVVLAMPSVAAPLKASIWYMGIVTRYQLLLSEAQGVDDIAQRLITDCNAFITTYGDDATQAVRMTWLYCCRALVLPLWFWRGTQAPENWLDTTFDYFEQAFKRQELRLHPDLAGAVILTRGWIYAAQPEIEDDGIAAPAPDIRRRAYERARQDANAAIGFLRNYPDQSIFASSYLLDLEALDAQLALDEPDLRNRHETTITLIELAVEEIHESSETNETLQQLFVSGAERAFDLARASGDDLALGLQHATAFANRALQLDAEHHNMRTRIRTYSLLMKLEFMYAIVLHQQRYTHLTAMLTWVWQLWDITRATDPSAASTTRGALLGLRSLLGDQFEAAWIAAHGEQQCPDWLQRETPETIASAMVLTSLKLYDWSNIDGNTDTIVQLRAAIERGEAMRSDSSDKAATAELLGEDPIDQVLSALYFHLAAVLSTTDEYAEAVTAIDRALERCRADAARDRAILLLMRAELLSDRAQQADQGARDMLNEALTSTAEALDLLVTPEPLMYAAALRDKAMFTALQADYVTDANEARSYMRAGSHIAAEAAEKAQALGATEETCKARQLSLNILRASLEVEPRERHLQTLREMKRLADLALDEIDAADLPMYRALFLLHRARANRMLAGLPSQSPQLIVRTLRDGWDAFQAATAANDESSVELCRGFLQSVRLDYADDFASFWQQLDIGELPLWLDDLNAEARRLAFDRSYDEFVEARLAKWKARRENPVRTLSTIAAAGERLLELLAEDEADELLAYISKVYYQDVPSLRAEIAYCFDSLGLAYEDAHQPEQALAAFTRAVDIQPEYLDWRADQARLLIELGQTEHALEAIAYLRQHGASADTLQELDELSRSP